MMKTTFQNKFRFAADRDTSSEKTLLVLLLVEFSFHPPKKKPYRITNTIITSCFILYHKFTEFFALKVLTKYVLYMRLRLESDYQYILWSLNTIQIYNISLFLCLWLWHFANNNQLNSTTPAWSSLTSFLLSVQCLYFSEYLIDAAGLTNFGN
jgi:hypothetical protein